MADIIGADERATTHNVDIYWHYKGDPVQRSQLLGTYNIGAPQTVLLPVPTDSDIILRAVPRGGRGQTWMAGPGDADPVEIHVPGLGTGGGTSNFYQQLRLNHGYSYGTTPTPRPALNLLQAFQIKDDSASGESDLSTFGVPTGMLNAKTDYNASGQIAVTTGTISAGFNILTLAATLDLQPGMGVYVAGAGPSGGPLITTITAVSADGKTLTLATNASGPASGALVQADDTAAIQAWINAKGDLWLPPGYYRLTSSIVLPTTSEGFSVIIHGSGWDATVFAFQHGGDGFVPTSDLKIDSFTLMDLTVGTGTIGDPNGTIDATGHGIGIRMTAPSYTGIYNNFVMQRCRVIGWGAFGIWSDNMEVSWITDVIFRENGGGHVAFVGPDQISPNKQPNANTLTNCTYDQGVGVNDAKRNISGSMTAGSRILSGSGFTAAERGKFVIVHGAATNNSDLFTFIDSFQSSSQVTLAHQAQVTPPGSVSVEIFQRNVASILLNRANDTVVDGATIQGNFVGCSPTTDINAIKVYNSANLRIVGVHEEDNAGFGGAALRMDSCQSVSIDNWGGTSAEAALQNAHNADFHLVNCHSVRVAQSFFNDRPQFVIDSSSSEVEVDNSFVVGWINLWQQDNSWDKLRVGSGVRIYQSADPRTNQSCGNEYIYDSLFGRDLLANGRFIDSPAMTSWTTINPTWWTQVVNSFFKGGAYVKVNSTGIADNGGMPATILHQAVPIPDTLPAGGFTLGFDWYIESQAGSASVSGRYTEIRAHPSTGIDEAMQWSVRPFTYVTGVWQTAQIKCWLGSGTSRTIDVQVNVTPGPNNVIIRFANFRLAAGKHVFGAWERAIHDFGGRMRAPIEFEPISVVNYPPPPVGSSIITLINQAGALKLGANGSYATLATGASSAGHTIQEEGAALAAQPFLNFSGAGITATNDVPNTATKVTVNTASVTLEGTVSTAAQSFAGRKTFTNGLQSNDSVGVPIVAQYTGATSGAHIQDWWAGGSFPFAYIDTQPTLTLGSPSGQAGRSGFLELYDGSTVNSVKLAAGSGSTASQEIHLPKALPSAAGQVLQVQTVGGGLVQLQWSTTAGGGYSTLQEEGTNLAVRTTLNFAGAGFTAADDPGSNRTTLTLFEATQTQTGVVNTGTQTFGGRKTFNSGATMQGIGGIEPIFTVQSLVGSASNVHLQEWNDDVGSSSVGFFDKTANLRLGNPFVYRGTLELCSNAASTTTKFQCASSPAASLLYIWPAATPTAAQVLGVQSVAGSTINLAWQTAGGGGVAGSGTLNRLPLWTPNGTTLGDSGFGDNGTSLIMYRSLVMNTDGTLNIGDPTNRVGAIYLKNAFFVYPIGSTTSSPKAAGFLDPAPGEATRLLICGNQSVAQGGNNLRTQITAYHSLELRGNRRSTTPPGYTTIPGVDSSGVLVYQEATDCIPLLVNSGFNVTSNLFQVQNNFSDRLRLNSIGSLWLNGNLRLAVAFIQPTAGAIIDLANYFNYHVLILDTLNGSFTLSLPTIASGYDGYSWRLICNRRTSANTVTVKCQAGNDINETTVGATSGWILRPNTNGARDAIVVADNSTSQWWLGNLTV